MAKARYWFPRSFVCDSYSHSLSVKLSVILFMGPWGVCSLFSVKSLYPLPSPDHTVFPEWSHL